MNFAGAGRLETRGPVFLLRFFPLLILAIGSLVFAAPAPAQISPDSDKLLHRMFAGSDFDVKFFGPARWLDDGEFYTTVEPSAAQKDARDIVRYETATGKREVLVAATKLSPPGAKSPLANATPLASSYPCVVCSIPNPA